MSRGRAGRRWSCVGEGRIREKGALTGSSPGKSPCRRHYGVDILCCGRRSPGRGQSTGWRSFYNLRSRSRSQLQRHIPRAWVKGGVSEEGDGRVVHREDGLVRRRLDTGDRLRLSFDLPSTWRLSLMTKSAVEPRAVGDGESFGFGGRHTR